MDLQSLRSEALRALDAASSSAEVDAVYNRFLGRKDGELTKILRQLGALSPDQRKAVGQQANELQRAIKERIDERQKAFRSAALQNSLQSAQIDPSLPGDPVRRGHSHPIVETIREMSAIFRRRGFDVASGPEVETDFRNFTALNLGPDHPARDAHDTFYLDPRAKLSGETNATGPLLLRTHTSTVQIQFMQKIKPPVRIVSPGRVFRNEAVDATHAATFHQFEGLVIDENTSFADLKAILTYFANAFFGSGTQVRFRPGYFPFVEPGAEMDVQCFQCRGEKRLASGAPCNICKATGWIELLGAGMVHPGVLRNVGYDAERYTGYAFGMGVERVVMTRLQIPDIRYFLESDLRFLEQYR